MREDGDHGHGSRNAEPLVPAPAGIRTYSSVHKTGLAEPCASWAACCGRVGIALSWILLVIPKWILSGSFGLLRSYVEILC